jgi:hypothetical protein
MENKDRRRRLEERALEEFFDSTPSWEDLEREVVALHEGRQTPLRAMSDSALHSELLAVYVCDRCGKIQPENRVDELEDPEISRDGGLLELFDLGVADPGDCVCTREQLEEHVRQRLGLDPLGLAGGGG